jgi:hypothetical protein
MPDFQLLVASLLGWLHTVEDEASPFFDYSTYLDYRDDQWERYESLARTNALSARRPSELEVELGVDAVDLRSFDERVHHRSHFRSALGARAEMIYSAQHHTA